METNTPNKIKKVLDALREGGDVHLRGIAKITGLPIGTVNWIVNSYLYPDFVDITPYSEFGFKAKVVRLKREATVDDVINLKMLRKRIRGKAIT